MPSNPRLMPHHLLVIPIRHAERLIDLTVDEMKELFETSIEYQELIIKKVATGCDITQHLRPFLPESEVKVDHVHLHLRPRTFEDELYKKSQIFERDIFNKATPKELDQTLKLFSSSRE